jgi:hypothetical protein
MFDLNQSNAIHKLLILSKSDEANYIEDINTDEFPLQTEDVNFRKGSFRLHLPLGEGQGPPRLSEDPSLLNPNPNPNPDVLSQHTITPSSQNNINGRDNDILKSTVDKSSQKSDISNISVCDRSEISVHWNSTDEKDFKGDKERDYKGDDEKDYNSDNANYDHYDDSGNTAGLGLGIARRQDCAEAKRGNVELYMCHNIITYICICIYIYIHIYESIYTYIDKFLYTCMHLILFQIFNVPMSFLLMVPRVRFHQQQWERSMVKG